MMRFCPNCESERSITEMICEGDVGGAPCGWDLSGSKLRSIGWRPPAPIVAGSTIPTVACRAGHVVDAGDLLCPTCGADLVESGPPTVPDATEPGPITEISGWRLERNLPSTGGAESRYLVTKDGVEAVLTLYGEGREPDAEIYDVLHLLPRDHVPEILETGRWGDRAFEVGEDLKCGTLAEVGLLPNDHATLSRILSEVGGALNSLSERGVRHRDLRPDAIWVRSRDPLDLVITSFGSARLSDFDLDIVSPLETTRYTAPEAVAGGVAAASDWWSLGMVLLEQVTRGACFQGVNDQAFLIHVLTNGAPIPEGLDPALELLLRGLLALDRRERWGWEQAQRWLAGDPPPAPASARGTAETRARQGIRLGGRSYTSPTAFALAAADAGTWDEARALLLGGPLGTWAQDADLASGLQRELNDLAQRHDLTEDVRLALALKALNPAMPLACRGEIITPGWLLDHPDAGYALISGPAPDLLERKGAEPWLARLKARATQVRERARQLDVVLSEPELQVHLLSTSRARLAALWADRRSLLPDTDHPGLLAILERRISADEDFILLLSADVGQFRTADAIVAEAAELSKRAGIDDFDEDQAAAWLQRSRREIYVEIEDRLQGFARCGIDRVDEWADQFRLERRLGIGRTLALLAVARSTWREPPKQQYVSTLLGFFSKRITRAVMRGPLTRMTITKSSARLDLTELGGRRMPSAAILDHLLLRSEPVLDLDPEAFTVDPRIERRIRTVHSHATLYRRDTGIDGLYLGFPFLVMQEPKASVKPRIAPILLWPIRLKPEVGSRGRITIGFDRDREEVRLNPAFETLLGPEAHERWRAVADELLGRSSLNAAQIMEGFADLVAGISGTSLVPIPNKDVKALPREDQVVCAGAIFHLAYFGQAVMEDLRHLQRVPPAGSSLETALRVGEPIRRPASKRPAELDRFFTAASDPSQEQAVLEARDSLGLLIEGPPGTGKSQTIVNMVSDAIGRKKSLLIVCQKQAALEVVHKRLVAEGLAERIVMINDVNKDRKPVIQAVRDQLEELFSRSTGATAWMQQRQQTAARIEALETDLDQHHAALHAHDPASGLSYRLILGDLIGLADGARPAIDVATLRGLLGRLDVGGVVALQETIAPLARLWLPSDFEGSALAETKSFSPDEGTLAAFEGDFTAFRRAEADRVALVERTAGAISIVDPGPWQEWTERNAVLLTDLAADDRERLGRWLELLRKPAIVEAQLAELSAVILGLEQLRPRPKLSWSDTTAINLSSADLASWTRLTDTLSLPPSLLQRLSWARWSQTSKVAKFLKGKGFDAAEFRQSLHDEAALRPLRDRLEVIALALAEPASELIATATVDLLAVARALRTNLASAFEVASRLAQHPQPDLAYEAVRPATVEAVRSLLERQELGYLRYEARGLSRASLQELEPWFDGRWLGARGGAIDADASNGQAIAALVEAFPTLGAYQKFRPRVSQLDPFALTVFKALRVVAPALKRLPEAELDEEVRRILGRESRLAWKARMESERPVLHFDSSELESKVRALAGADAEMRRLNRVLLVDGLDATQVRPRREWEDITRLSGVRARRLREFLDRGTDLGLMSLRPVWLMNPDVASRVLPLKKSLFDTVIYDEASQMPIEYALPSLFRSRKMIVSGDEKQMPPTNFFSSKVENDEADVFEGDDGDDEAGEGEREAAAESWNRREIKDCPDLLQLAKTVVPSTTLQIHYRSAFRELIEFSNAAFYDGRLSVPARHPDDEVRRAKPIEIVRVDGVYSAQTNEEEARRVVDIVAGYWRAPPATRPTLGVVTFNRKQADLIDDVLEERAERDSAFRAALAQERDRIEQGEDVGFFVKNVENVQGDERGVIIFSSTFGRNEQGAFRRSFGVLGQTGGERRLNVAVSRAKDKVVLVTSMPIAEISDMLTTRRAAATPRDHLQAYFEYARALSAGELDNARNLLGRLGVERKDAARRGDQGEDGFQAAVRSYVESLGYSVHSAADAGAFAVDFAIVNPNTGLFGIGIECDAPRHALLTQARSREMWRPFVLRRSIRAVHRVSSHGWFHRPDAEKAKLRSAIAQALQKGAAA